MRIAAFLTGWLIYDRGCSKLRLAKLDAPGVLHNVMSRGIEKRKIFWNDKNRVDFIDRLAGVVEKGIPQGRRPELVGEGLRRLVSGFGAQAAGRKAGGGLILSCVTESVSSGKKPDTRDYVNQV